MTDARRVAAPHALRECAFVADGERGALIGPQGHYAWMCFPSWESPAVFTPAAGPAACSPEEYDVAQRQLRANIPQALVHAALLETGPPDALRAGRRRPEPLTRLGLDVLDRSPGWG